jgi:hypothetical protein
MAQVAPTALQRMWGMIIQQGLPGTYGWVEESRFASMPLQDGMTTEPVGTREVMLDLLHMMTY